MNKLALIIDPSEVYLNKQVNTITKEWGYNLHQKITTNLLDISQLNTPSLFEPTFVHLDLSEKDKLKQMTEWASKQKDLPKNWIGNGLLITTTTSVGTSKLIKFVEQWQGTIINKEKPEEIKQKLIKSFELNKELSQFLDDFAGEDYDKLVALQSSLEGMTKEQKQSIQTIEDLYTYLPSKSGAIPPWSFIDNLFKGDIPNALKTLDRTLENTFPLILVVLLRQKINALYQYTLGRNLGKVKLEDIGKIFKAKNHYTYIGPSKTKKLSLQTVEEMQKLMFQLECDLKGSSVINFRDRLRLFVLQFTSLLRKG